MNNNFIYNINYDNMKQIVANYFLEQGRRVVLEIDDFIDNDRFYGTVTSIMYLIEIRTLMGIESSIKTIISIDDLKDILASILEQEGKELIDLKNNTITSSRIVGYGMIEQEEKTIVGKSFTITAREKERSR